MPMTDKLAKLTVKEKYTGTESMVGVTVTLIRNSIQEKNKNEHQKYWEAT